MRAHLYRVITNSSGDVQPEVTIRILQTDVTPPSTASLVVDPFFSTKTGTVPLANPYVIYDGIVDIWMDTPQFVMLGMTTPGDLETYIDNALVAAIASGSGGSGTIDGSVVFQMDTDNVPYFGIANDGSGNMEVQFWPDSDGSLYFV